LSAVRIQKLIAEAGLASRREAENWIREGRVRVNGRAAALGDRADPVTDAIRVDGKRIPIRTGPRSYVLLNKPKGYVTTTDDPEGRHTVPLSMARVARAGEQCTVLAYGAMVPVSVEAASSAAERGWSVEVVDLRTLVPLDSETVLESARKTGRVVIVHEAPRTCGFGAELAALVAERAITALQAPILRVTGYDTPFPYTLEHSYLPDAPRVLRAIEHVMAY